MCVCVCSGAGIVTLAGRGREREGVVCLLLQDGFTPLMAASKKGQKDVVKVLLANGADVTIVSVKVTLTLLPLLNLRLMRPVTTSLALISLHNTYLFIQSLWI